MTQRVIDISKNKAASESRPKVLLKLFSEKVEWRLCYKSTRLDQLKLKILWAKKLRFIDSIKKLDEYAEDG